MSFRRTARSSPIAAVLIAFSRSRRWRCSAREAISSAGSRMVIPNGRVPACRSRPRPECPFARRNFDSMLGLDEQNLERRSLARNEVLFRQGQKVTAIFFVEQGRLRLERQTFDGRSLVLGTTTSGKFFVEAALFADIFHCDAVATEQSQVCIYPKAQLLNALRANPANAMSFLSLMAHQVIELRHRIEIMKVLLPKSASCSTSISTPGLTAGQSIYEVSF